ncbi:Protein fam72a [Entomortierella beljakovae]|nr:Protein fam72a [Entomortierella beljakovae]
MRTIGQQRQLTRPDLYHIHGSDRPHIDHNMDRTMETDDSDEEEMNDDDDSDQESTGTHTISTSSSYQSQNQYGNAVLQSQPHSLAYNQQPIHHRPVPPTPQRTNSRIWLQHEGQFRLQEINSPATFSHTDQYQQGQTSRATQPRLNLGDNPHPVVEGQQPRPAFLRQPVYQLACAACIRPLCLRAMKAVMLSDHSKELYSTDMPPTGLQLVNDDRQVRHCACRIRDSACLGCGQVAGYHVTQPCSDCLSDQNNGHFWMFYSSAVYHYKRNRIDGSTGDVMLWATVPSISYDQALSQQLRQEVPILSIQTKPMSVITAGTGNQAINEDRPMTACVEMDEWLNSPVSEVICR